MKLGVAVCGCSLSGDGEKGCFDCEKGCDSEKGCLNCEKVCFCYEKGLLLLRTLDSVSFPLLSDGHCNDCYYLFMDCDTDKKRCHCFSWDHG